MDKSKDESKPVVNNNYGLASMILGICSIVVPFFGIVCGILAVVFATKQNKIEKTGMATAGLITGIIGIVLGFSIFLLWGSLFSLFSLKGL